MTRRLWFQWKTNNPAIVVKGRKLGKYGGISTLFELPPVEKAYIFGASPASSVTAVKFKGA